jgi:type IX secretion system PorP/SprF family membrane protein
MKRILLSLTLIAAVAKVSAQQDPQYTQFFMNKLSYNPAYAGAEEKICATGLYRTQWLGFGDDKAGLSPVTIVGNIHAPLGVNQRIGVGLNVISDVQGFEESLNPKISGAFRQPLKNGHTLAFGVGIGLMQKSLAGDKLKPQQTGDAKIPTTAVNGRALDLDAGVYYTMPNIWRFNNAYAGISATHLTQGNVEYSWANYTTSNPMKMHLYFMTGAAYQINGTWGIEPNILVKSDMAKTSADFNAMAVFNQKIKGGLTYRTADAISILGGYIFNINANSSLYIGYSYDFTTSNIISYSSGSHELLLRYCFRPKVTVKDKPVIPRLTPRFL